MKAAGFFLIMILFIIAGASGALAGSGTKITASDGGADDSFGNSVALDGDYAIVGAPYEDAGGENGGAVYIYHRTDANTWDAGTKITAADITSNDNFGFSVALSGDYAIVGSPYEDTGGNAAGAAYIFHRTDANTWDAGTKITAADAEADDYFGYSVSISGDYAIVSAHLEDTGGSGSGAAYIFRRTDTNTWDTGTKITASDPEAGDYFGYSVSISGDYAVVGAYGEDAGGSNAGAAYIFRRTDTNTWDTGTKVTASDAEGGDRFGSSVSISGDYAVIGAYLENSGGTGAGAAYIYHRTDTNTWDAGVKIVASDAQVNDWFGFSVSLAGDDAIVGSYLEDTGGGSAGAAYVYHRTDTNTWDTGAKIISSGAASGDYFGRAVSLSGDYAVIGATGVDTLGSGAGAAYVYQYDPPIAGKLLSPDPDTGDYFGRSVSLSGDYAIVGADHEETGGSVAGAAYIFHRTGANTWDEGTKIVAADAEADDLFGFSVSLSGDYAIVGASTEDAGGTSAGAAYIFYRTDTNAWDAGTKIVAPDAEAGDYFGRSVSLSGDYAIVGAHYESAEGTEAGAAYIFHRTDTNTWDAGTKIVASDASSYDNFGVSVSLSGDYALVGASGAGTGGAAYIFHRTDTNTWDTGTTITASDAETYDYFGYATIIAGDYAIVGAYGEDTGGADAGAAYIFHRTDTNTWDTGTKIMASDAEAGDCFGISVSLSGDYVMVGADWETTGGNGSGAAYLFSRTGDNTWSAGTKVTASDAAALDNYGNSVAISDSYAVVGAYRDDPDWPYNSGSAYVFLHGLPAAIDLLAFEAEWTDTGAALYWITGSETECGAFTLLRCELGDVWDDMEPNCPLTDFRELEIVIPCEDSLSGAEYEVLDATADPDAGYSYLLREYETTGGVHEFGPVLLYSIKYGDDLPGGDQAPGDDDTAALPDDDDDSGKPAATGADSEPDDDAGCGR